MTGLSVPSPAEAEAILAAEEARNPGPWAAHCRVAALCAQAIAAACPNLDAEAAYVMGLLHDVGRGSATKGTADVRHVLDGYTLLRKRGFEDAARICLTHSFPIKQADAFASRWECPPQEKRFVQDFLDRSEYSDYDRLIQLCDSLALPSGPCLVEKRLVDVALRLGFNTLTMEKWRAFLALRDYFDALTGGSIYRLLPRVVETTFGFE